MEAEKNIAHVNFRIKLVAGRNVVLVEADNYDTEVFSPQVVNGRISFLNVIPNRRCCQVENTNILRFSHKLQRETEEYIQKENFRRKNFDKSCERIPSLRSPLANSTPADVKHHKSYGSVFLNYNRCVSTTDSTLSTPEPVRRAPSISPQPLENSIFSLPRTLKVSRVYTNRVEGKSKKVGRIVSSPSNMCSMLNGSYTINGSPAVPQNNKSRGSVFNFYHSPAEDAISRWDKVLTPVRTYARNLKISTTSERTVSARCTVGKSIEFKLKPNYLANPTKAPYPNKEITIKRRKLIVDPKIFISPKTFKKQQTSLDLAAEKSSTIYISSLGFHKPRNYSETIGMTAFDMLTNSNRSIVMSKRLNEQFRKGCVNKSSSTYLKYKVLSTVPPLQEDEQVLELRRMLKYRN